MQLPVSRLRLGALAGAVTLLVLLGGRCFAAESAKQPPLEIAKQGWLFAGGHIDQAQPNNPMVGQIYAEYQIPTHRTHPYPVVMIEGGSQSGTNFTGTPDGREGWAQYFLRRGYVVYVVDQPGRGRSAYDEKTYGPASSPNMKFEMERFAAPEKSMLWPQARLHRQWPGKAEIGDPIFDNFYSSQMPSIADFSEQQALMRDAGAALLDKTGPAILLIHSQSGAFAWPIIQARPRLVRGVVAVEPSGPPVHDVQMLGAPDWFKDAPKLKISGLADIPLQYDPPLKDGEQLQFEQADAAKAPDSTKCWAQKSPARRLVAVAETPILMITSEASYHAPYDDCTAAYLRQAGVKHLDHIHLAALGIKGNGHMMMQEKNSDAIAQVMVDWLGKQAWNKK